MICKLFVLAVCAVAVYAQADKYPAGLNPALCPNYPNCDNTVVHLTRAAPVAWTAPHGRQYPAGVNPALCPNYPYCDNGATYPIAYAASTWGAWPYARQYPAGVNPAACPNYPYCH
ncbi:hypothetical protein B566_EDAN012512 [Ephemera danica]|nr:hypothetical protein B566_EDAN012512 [Ephemera danica]